MLSIRSQELGRAPRPLSTGPVFVGGEATSTTAASSARPRQRSPSPSTTRVGPRSARRASDPDPYVRHAWWVRGTSEPWANSLPTTPLRSEPVSGWSSPLRAFSTGQMPRTAAVRDYPRTGSLRVRSRDCRRRLARNGRFGVATEVPGGCRRGAPTRRSARRSPSPEVARRAHLRVRWRDSAFALCPAVAAHFAGYRARRRSIEDGEVCGSRKRPTQLRRLGRSGLGSPCWSMRPVTRRGARARGSIGRAGRRGGTARRSRRRRSAHEPARVPRGGH
jgi:hypothetical protein